MIYNHETLLWLVFMSFPKAKRLLSLLEITLGTVILMIGLSFKVGSRMECQSRQESHDVLVNRTW